MLKSKVCPPPPPPRGRWVKSAKIAARADPLCLLPPGGGTDNNTGTVPPPRGLFALSYGLKN